MRQGFGALLFRSDPCVADCAACAGAHAACTPARVACVSVRIAGEEHRDPLGSIAALAIEHSTAVVGASPLQRVVTLVRVVEDARAKFTIGSPVLKDKRVLYDFLLTHIGSRDNEVFAMLLLDCQLRLLEYVELFHGDPASSAVYPREVVKWVVATRATDVIIAHNHPTGDLGMISR